MDQLKNKDLAVAQRLAQFCANTKNKPVKERYLLYLCQISYCFAFDPEYEYEDEEDKERTVHLEGPWKCVDDFSPSAGFKTFEVFWKQELAPIGRFDCVKFDSKETHYTGNEGMRRECWYKNAALVVLPQLQVYKRMIESGPQSFIFQWRQPVFDSNTETADLTEAKYFAELAFAKRAHQWHNVAHWFELSVDTAVRMNDVEVFAWVVRSSMVFEFDTNRILAKAVAHFGWNLCLPKLFEVMEDRVQELNLRSRANLISSLTATEDEDGVASDADCSASHVDQIFTHFLSPPPLPNAFNVIMARAINYRSELKISDEVDKEEESVTDVMTAPK